MSDNVRLDSVEALTAFRIWLVKAVEAMQVGLDEADSEIQRASVWLEHEQASYWKGELHKRSELVARAKLELQRKQQQMSPLGGHYSYVDEKKALALAQRRYAEAEQKLAAVKRWSRELEQEMFTYQGAVRGLTQAVHQGMPDALSKLDGMIAAIESYMSVKPLSEQPSTAPGLDEAVAAVEHGSMSMARQSGEQPQAADEQYAKLRRRVPDQATRDGVAISDGRMEWANPHRLDEDQQNRLAALDVQRKDATADEKIVMAGGVRDQAAFFLTRSKASDGDSGWYIGFIDDREINSYEAWHLGDLPDTRPDLLRALTLPVGSLVIIDAAKVRTVYDPGGQVVWHDDTEAR